MHLKKWYPLLKWKSIFYFSLVGSGVGQRDPSTGLHLHPLFMVHLWYLSLTQCTSNCWWEALPCQHGRNASVTWILQTKARGTVTVCLRLLNISNRKKNRSLNLLALETYKKGPVLFHKLHCFESSNGHLLVSKSWYLIL